MPAAGPPASLPHILAGVSAVGPFLVVVTQEVVGEAGVLESYLWALDAKDGDLAWSVNSTIDEQLGNLPSSDEQLGNFPSSYPTGTDNVVYATMGPLLAINPRGEAIWRQELGERDAVARESNAGFALVGGTLYAASAQTIYALDTVAREVLWLATLPPDPGEAWGASPLLVAGGVLYARSFLTAQQGVVNAVYALDARQGSFLWRREFSDSLPPVGRHFEFGLGEGVIAVAGFAAASRSSAAPPRRSCLPPGCPRPTPPPGSSCPRTSPGAKQVCRGPATSFRADWGDGNATEWQASPLLTHSYAERGDHAARFQVRNDAGQEASAWAKFYVGQRPPVELNALQVAFSRENQELTLFALGLAVTGAVTVPSVARLRRRKLRLQRGLQAVEQAYAMTREKPRECEAALQERKAHARGLLLDAKLDEAQFVILERRIDELSSQVRLSSLEDEFDFLPVGIVRTLEGMLQDGRITRWEHRHFLEALERDALLTPEQKAKVQALIDEWFARDSRGGPRP